MNAPPKYMRDFLTRLSNAGFESFLAGGCVRDLVMGLRPNDYDVATPALPEDIHKIFKKTYDTGVKHGTVTVLYRSKRVEVTTFRSEGGYIGHRRPEAVRFESDITADLSRRDFTMNAMALSKEGALFDPFGGICDISKKIIRAVGEPERRFDEDALRMLRALRFSAVLGFEIKPQTLAAIKKMAPLARSLSAERVRDELLKTLLSSRPQTIAHMVSLGLLDDYLPGGFDLSPIARLPKRAGVRLTALCLYSGSEPERLLRNLKFDNKTINTVSAALATAKDMPEDDYTLKRALGKHGAEALSIAAALSKKRKATALRRILASGECFSLEMLAVGGDDLAALGISPGRDMGRILEGLYDHALRHPEDNRREILEGMVKKDLGI